MINPNKFIGLKQQQSMGQLTDPQSFQQQFNVNRFTQPLAVPGDQNQTMSPMMQTNYPNAGVKQRAAQPLPKPDMPDNRLKRTTEKIEQVTQQNAPLKQTDPDKKMFVVNKEKTGTRKDTLFLPPDTFVSKSGYAEDSDIEKISRKAAADNIYNYSKGKKNYNFEYLEDGGKVKYKN